MSGPYVSIQPNLTNITNIGIAVTWPGIIMVASNTMNSASRPRNSSRANA